MKFAGLLLLCAILGAMIYIRFVPVDYARFAADPLLVDPSENSNYVLMRPGGNIAPPEFVMPADELVKAVDRTIMQTPGTRRVSVRGLADVRVYVTRSRIWKFPDVISVKVVDRGDSLSQLNIFSRSVYGGYDWGQNEARVIAWLEQLR